MVTVAVTVRRSDVPAPRPPPRPPRPSAAATDDPVVLQCLRLVDAGSDAREIAGRRMTAAAFRGEVHLAGLGVANQRVWRRRFAFRRRPLAARGDDHAVDVFGDGHNVGIGQRQRRHAAFGARTVDDRKNQLAVLIHQHHGRTQQVGSARHAAAKIGAVAGAAVGHEESASLARWFQGRRAAAAAPGNVANPRPPPCSPPWPRPRPPRPGVCGRLRRRRRRLLR